MLISVCMWVMVVVGLCCSRFLIRWVLLLMWFGLRLMICLVIVLVCVCLFIMLCSCRCVFSVGRWFGIVFI